MFIRQNGQLLFHFVNAAIDLLEGGLGVIDPVEVSGRGSRQAVSFPVPPTIRWEGGNFLGGCARLFELGQQILQFTAPAQPVLWWVFQQNQLGASFSFGFASDRPGGTDFPFQNTLNVFPAPQWPVSPRIFPPEDQGHKVNDVTVNSSFGVSGRAGYPTAFPEQQRAEHKPDENLGCSNSCPRQPTQPGSFCIVLDAWPGEGCLRGPPGFLKWFHSIAKPSEALFLRLIVPIAHSESLEARGVNGSPISLAVHRPESASRRRGRDRVGPHSTVRYGEPGRVQAPR